MKPNVVVALYGHPEAYPPTLNAIDLLAPMAGHIDLLFRPSMKSVWAYPPNVSLLPSGEPMSVREQQALPLIQRYRLVAGFTKDLATLVRRRAPQLVLLYDGLALLAYAGVRRLCSGRPLVWYHNHDVTEPGAKLGSLVWFAQRAEARMFSKIDLFTLPAAEREAHFPMRRLRGRCMLLPNLPSLSRQGSREVHSASDSKLDLVFQGIVAAGRGIEEVLALMPCEVKGRPLHLTLVGHQDPAFCARLRSEVAARQLENRVRILDFVPYRDLFKVTETCHVGLALYGSSNVMEQTVATASNKIYEYAALGLPVLYRDNAHFRKHLGAYEWAVPVGPDTQALRSALELIVDRYEGMSSAARRDFRAELNFEHHFGAVQAFLEDQLG